MAISGPAVMNQLSKTPDRARNGKTKRLCCACVCVRVCVLLLLLLLVVVVVVV